MRLIIVRHAIAMPRETAKMEDEDRPLTKRGAKRFRRAAAGLARVERRPDILLTSPLVRARQTADLLSDAWGGPDPREDEGIAGTPAEILQVLARQPIQATVAIVGHEPDFSQLVAQLVGAKDGSRFEFKKGGAACVSLPGAVDEGGALLWYQPPRHLRRLAR
jgi:phosphohistidine phosphatase